MTFKEFEDFLLSANCFDNHDVAWIEKDHKVRYHAQDDYWDYFAFMSKLLAEEECTIKIEQMERYYNISYATVHLFYSPVNGPTFEEHTDPVDVTIKCTDGLKALSIDGKKVTLEPNDYVFIPAGTLHKALNYDRSVMLSYGANDTETLNRLREDNRNMQPQL